MEVHRRIVKDKTKLYLYETAIRFRHTVDGPKSSRMLEFCFLSFVYRCPIFILYLFLPLFFSFPIFFLAAEVNLVLAIKTPFCSCHVHDYSSFLGLVPAGCRLTLGYGSRRHPLELQVGWVGRRVNASFTYGYAINFPWSTPEKRSHRDNRSSTNIKCKRLVPQIPCLGIIKTTVKTVSFCRTKCSCKCHRSKVQSKKISSGDLVELDMKNQSDFLLSLNLHSDYKVTVSPHRSLNTVRGVISEDDLLDESERDILEGMSYLYVVAVSPISLRQDGELKPTKISSVIRSDFKIQE